MTRKLLPLAAVVLTSCAGSPDHIPRGGPSAQQVYNAHVSGELPGQQPMPTQRGEVISPMPPATYAIDAAAMREQLRREFPSVPNPELVGYVIGRVNERGTPIPTYPVIFRLYERDHYAQPGEAKY